MAKPIEPTPTLTGADAARLLKNIYKPVRSEKKQAFLTTCDNTYRALSAK